MQRLAVPFEAEDIRVMPFRIAAADTDHTVFGRNGNAISQWPREMSGRAPRAVRRRQDIDLIIPDFLAAFPRQTVRKVCPAADEQGVPANASERPRHAQVIRNRRKLFPVQ